MKKRAVEMTVRSILAILSLWGVGWAVFPYLSMGILNIGNLAASAVFLLLGFGAVCWPLVCRMWRRLGRRKASRICRNAVTGFLALCLAWAAFLSGWMAIAANSRPQQRDLPLLVLGCQVYGQRPSPMLESRLRAALSYLNDNPGAVCIVSGGQGTNESAAEASVMKRWLVEQGVAEQRILEEAASTNTEENLLFSKALMAENGLGDAVVIATDGFHQLRARLFAKKMGLTPYSQSCATRTDLFLTYYARELFGVTRVVVLGR